MVALFSERPYIEVNIRPALTWSPFVVTVSPPGGSVFASSGGYFPHLFPVFGNLRTGTTAARISSIKTFSSLS